MIDNTSFIVLEHTHSFCNCIYYLYFSRFIQSILPVTCTGDVHLYSEQEDARLSVNVYSEAETGAAF